MLMRVARVAATRSTCSRAHVGAVITQHGRVISTGYNGAPSKMPHCDHSCTCPAGWDDSEHAYDCASTQPCTVAVHAEENAIAFAARYGISTEGGVMYTTLSPCQRCAKLIINAGISQVIFATHYRNFAGPELLHAAGVQWRFLEEE